jgi:hypothetical protein
VPVKRRGAEGQAEARLAELIEAEPEAEGVLVILGTLDQPE